MLNTATTKNFQIGQLVEIKNGKGNAIGIVIVHIAEKDLYIVYYHLEVKGGIGNAVLYRRSLTEIFPSSELNTIE